MKTFLLVLVVIFISGFAGAKNSYLFNQVLVDGAYEQVIYSDVDVVLIYPGEKYSASYYININNIVSGTTVVEILSAPDYLELPLVFNDSTKNGFNFWFAENSSGQESYFRTDTTDNGFKSAWYCVRYPSAWLGDIEFINQLKVGDSIQYRITTECYKLGDGKSYLNHHTRTIKSATDVSLNFGQSLSPNYQELQISAFPNPFTSELTVNSFQNINVSILDIAGRVLESRQLQPGLTRISTTGLKPGLYFLKADKTAIRLIKK